MKRIDKLVLIVTIGALFLFSCSNNTAHKESSMSDVEAVMPSEDVAAEAELQKADVTSIDAPSSKSKNFVGEANQGVRDCGVEPMPNFLASKATLDLNDDLHKFIRTAQMKFKTKDVPVAAYAIEDIVIKNNGFIIRSSISNNSPYSKTTNISEDSTIVTYYNNLTASLHLKVPCAMLDETLRELAPLAITIDYRIVEAEDVTTRLMAERMERVRMANKNKRVSNAIDNRGRRLNDIMDAEEVLDNTMERADQAKIAIYELNDRIAYSDIHVELYQDRQEYQQTVARKKEDIKEYTPSIGSELIKALAEGWYMLSRILIFLINIWPVLLLILIALGVYWKYRKIKNSNNGK